MMNDRTESAAVRAASRAVDFFYVEPAHHAIHQELENWALYVEVKRRAGQAPIWRLGKSHGRQWHAPELKADVDKIAGMKMEKAVALLPAKQRDAIRWNYVWKDTPAVAARFLDVTYDTLFALVRTGRVMLINRAK